MAKRSSKSDHKILIVDDEKNYRIILSQLFSGIGYQVVTASGAEESLSVLRLEKVDLVLTDFYLAGYDGLTLCRRVQELTGGTPCILFSACLPSRKEHENGEAGIIYYVAKPFDVSELLTKVEQALLARPERSSYV